MSDRKAHWEKVYTDKSPLEVSWYQNEPTLSLRLIRNTGLAGDASIIDVGGGASILVDRLLEQGYHRVAVLDLSAHALDYARQRLGDQAGRVEWIEADVTEFQASHTFDLWHDRAVFHFLTDPADRANYVDALKRALAPDGHVIIAAFAIGGPTQCSGLDIVQYDAAKLQGELGDAFELVEESGEMHLTPASKEQKFGYFRFRSVGA
jgi:2-polyprenyl-3-methyl-5-hydroxy-6-metoxy-1,4-benzoquinol methylase